MPKFEHKVIKVFFKNPERLQTELVQYEAEGWQVAGVGQSLGSMIIILKRPYPPGKPPPPFMTDKNGKKL